MHRLLFICAALLFPTSLVGQRLAPVMARAPVPRFDHVLSHGTIPRTYWLEGGIIGGVTTGVLGTLWFEGVSESPHSLASTVAIGLLCSAVGFAPGALIGGQFHKH